MDVVLGSYSALSPVGLSHPHSPVGLSYPYSPVGLSHPHSLVGLSYPYSHVGLPYPYRSTGAVSAATMDVYGSEVAKIDLLATREDVRGQGHCRWEDVQGQGHYTWPMCTFHLAHVHLPPGPWAPRAR